MRRENLIFERVLLGLMKKPARPTRACMQEPISLPLCRNPSGQQRSLLYTLPIIATISRWPVLQAGCLFFGDMEASEMVPWALGELDKFSDLFFSQ
jgi:hypothetical protein